MPEEKTELPPLPVEWDWVNVMKLGEEADEASVLLYGPEIAARMKVAGLMLRQMPDTMREYALLAVRQERERILRALTDWDFEITEQAHIDKFAAAMRKGV